MKQMRTWLYPVLTAVCAGVAAADPQPWADAEQAASTHADLTAFFEDVTIRHPGSPGNLALEEKVQRRFAESGLPHGSMRFRCPAFMPGASRLELSDGTVFELHPMHPTLFRPGNFKERRFETRLVYLGRGTVADLKAVEGIDLQDAVAVMEYHSGDAWQQFLRFGIRGFLFLEGGQAGPPDAVGKVYGTEVAVPRFYVAGEEAEALRRRVAGEAGHALPGVLDCEPSRWETRFLRNLWVMIPGSHPTLQNEIVVISAPMDGNGVVPSLVESAQDGANLYCLMRLFDTFRETPPERTVLLAAVNAHTRRYLGERMLAWNLLVPRARVEQMVDTFADKIRLSEMYVEHYSKFALDPPTAEDAERIAELRTLMDQSTGRYLAVKEPIVDLARRNVNQIKGDLVLLKQMRSDEISPEELQKRLDELNVKLERYVNILTLFNKVGVKTELGDLSDWEVDILRSYVQRIVSEHTLWMQQNRRDIEMLVDNAGIRDVLEGRPLKFGIDLSLVWTTDRVGFWSGDYWGGESWSHRWGQNVARIAGALEGVRDGSRVDPFVDTMTKRGGLSEGYYFVEPTFSEAPFQRASRMPSFTLRNVFSDFGRSFSPDDTFENLPAERVGNLMAYVPALLRAILADEVLTSPSELRAVSGRFNSSFGRRLYAYKFDRLSAAVVPTVPVPFSAILLQVENWRDREQPVPPLIGGNVVNTYMQMTDERAAGLFVGLHHEFLSPRAMHFDDDFVHIDHAIDAGESENKASSLLEVRGNLQKTLALFECREFPVYERRNSAAISVEPITMESYLPLSGKLDSAPKRYGFTGMKSIFSPRLVYPTLGPAAVFMPEVTDLKLLTSTRYGVLNASPDEPEGIGFRDPAAMGPDFFGRTSRDLAFLNRSRLAGLRGVTDELAAEYFQRGNQALERMDQAQDERRHTAYLRSLYEALGAHVKAYVQMTGISNDMLKAVVFYMALMLPFCFFVEKLLFKFVRIEYELLVFALLFVLTFMLFRRIHPAFQIAQTPEAIFVAFVMGGLGLFVIKILHDRFEGQMQLLFRDFPGMMPSEVGFSTVGQEAMLIGVNNMKRRRIRTTLTTATVVLVTFTMLAFTSVSKKLSPTVISRNDRAPYTGLMVHWPGNAMMDEATLQVFRDLFDLSGDVLVRRWVLPRSGNNRTVDMHVEVPGKGDARIEGLLGLSVGEDGFLDGIPLRAGRWFSSDEADEAIIPQALAKALGVEEADVGQAVIRYAGRELSLVGILDDARFRNLEDLNQRPILPIKDLLHKTAGSQGDAAAKSQGDKGGDTGIFYVDMSAMMVAPVARVKALGGRPYSVSVRFAPETDIWPVVDEVLTVTGNCKFFVASERPFSVGGAEGRETQAGVYFIGEGARTSVGGLSFLIIPLLIAGSIILNTMLGSVFERKNEIAVYNAVGLNPTHIGMFFLAEAFVYSVIGSVGGYLIGQMLSLGLMKTGLIADINLNFSSLSVVYVILFTIAMVMLSTLYPSMVATKAAVPSGKRKWSLPDHDGTVMETVFPFIYQPNLVVGIMGYLDEYFGRFTEASFGDLIAQPETIEQTADDKGLPVYVLQYDASLAPFDLGVTQGVGFRAAFDERIQAYRVTIRIERRTGQDSNWVTTNRPFLEKLRTYLLHWRNLTQQEHAVYVEAGKRCFDKGDSPRVS